MKMRSLAAAALCCALAGTAQGASLSFSNLEQATPISQSGVLDLFDSLLGTLNSVTLTLNLSSSTTFHLTSSAAQTENVTAYATIPMYFGSSLAGLNTTLSTLAPALTEMQASSGPLSLAAGSSLDVGPLSVSKTFDLTSFSGLDQSEFAAAGGGSFSLFCENTDGKRLDGGNGQVSLGVSTQAACGASIVYDYTPSSRVTEPASLALVGLGALGLLGARLRRRPS